MKTFRITNPTTGADLGTYPGATPAAALDAMARDAGYSDYADCCADVPAPEGGLTVTEVEVELSGSYVYRCERCHSPRVLTTQPESTVCAWGQCNGTARRDWRTRERGFFSR